MWGFGGWVSDEEADPIDGGPRYLDAEKENRTGRGLLTIETRLTEKGGLQHLILRCLIQGLRGRKYINDSESTRAEWERKEMGEMRPRRMNRPNMTKLPTIQR